MIDLIGSEVYIVMVEERNLVGYERQGAGNHSHPTRVFFSRENAEKEAEILGRFHDFWILPVILGDTLKIH